MRLILTGLLLFVKGFTFAQFTDNFSDGDFTSNPVWIGMTSNFEVDGSQKLHLLAPVVNDTSYLVVNSNAINDFEWSFKVDLDFGTSGSNLARVYLSSDNSNLKQSLNGYFVMIGNSADEVSLYRQDGTAITKIIDGTDAFVGADPVSVRVKVIRSGNGNWSLFADNSGGLNYVSQGQVQDNTYNTSSYFGVFCQYTATRSDKFYFDDFTVSEYSTLDTIPPKLVDIKIIDENSLDLILSESVIAISSENEVNYLADNGIGQPVSAVLSSNGQVVRLDFDSDFMSMTSYQLFVQNIEDDSGNLTPQDIIEFEYFDPIVEGDIIVTEVMADPQPVIGLPEFEYIEIHNRSAQSVNLSGWTISDATSPVMLPETQLLPDTYLLLCEPGSAVQYGIANTLEIDLPALNNNGDAVVLKNESGMIIDSIYYTRDWYGDPDKAEGGWSLERKNLVVHCPGQSNWSASNHNKGGTPGVLNSVNNVLPDLTLPNIRMFYMEADSLLHIVFDKTISDGTLNIIPGTDFEWVVKGNEILITCPYLIPKQVYDLEVSGFTDCWGNKMLISRLNFGLPEIPEKNDVLINEILFNPVTNGSDYVELVNVSDKIIALNDLNLANINDGIIDNVKPISEFQFLLLPKAYILITEDSSDIIKNFPDYKPGCFYEADLPTYNNDSGTVVLMNQYQTGIDRFSYHEDLHFKLLNNVEGKALERLSLIKETEARDNWHTASEIVGWGTPGYLNSQTISSPKEGKVILNNGIFSPDNDGYQDVLAISYTFDTGDNIMDIKIYDSKGFKVRELKDNFYPGITGTVVWDGITDNNEKAAIGAYIIHVTVFDLEGNHEHYKLVGVLAGHL